MACRIAKRVEHHIPARHGGCARREHADLGIGGLYTIAAAHMVAIRPRCLIFFCGFENVHAVLTLRREHGKLAVTFA
jgi:hypothetical protein